MSILAFASEVVLSMAVLVEVASVWIVYAQVELKLHWESGG